jgi:hypothetical protein
LNEQLTPDKVSVKPTFVSHSKIVFFFLLGGFLFIGSNLFTSEYKAFIPIAPKQYPRNVSEQERHYKI